MKYFKRATKSHNIKKIYMEGRILENRKQKRPNKIRNFISGQILLNKNMIKFLGCYKLYPP